MTKPMPQASADPSFTELLNARAAELGLMSAPEIAQRMIAEQPAAAKVDLARSVRNWQSGRNLPRPDFYPLLLTALDVQGDPDRRKVWNAAYGQARRTGAPAPDGMASVPAPDASPAPVPRGVPPRRRLRWPAPAALAIAVALASAWALRPAPPSAVALACDAAAGASWDPGRETAVPAVAAGDLAWTAIGLCETATRAHPDEGRLWFQLGRARDHAGAPADRARAHAAFRRADALGHAPAALSLGHLHEEGLAGDEGSPDLRTAASHYARAARAGLAGGHYCHAVSLLFGWSGARPDPAAAAEAARAALAAGSARAAGLLADLDARAGTTLHTACASQSDAAPLPIPPGGGGADVVGR